MKHPLDPSYKATDVIADVRAKLVRAAIFGLLSRRQQGEDVNLEQFQSDHADLMPELAEAIAIALRTYRHVLDAKRAWGEPGSNAYSTSPSSSRLPAIQGYRMRRELGSGGQGIVFEAVHEPTGRVVAVKVLTGLSKNAVARFDREARTLAQLSHPGLLAILDRGVTRESAYYLAVEYVGGTDLDEWIGKLPKEKASVRIVIALFAKIADALGVAHVQGIVHRDLKPSNIRVDTLGNPRVIDFGMARLIEQDEEDRRLTVTRDVVGSVNWLSPEQASGNIRSVGPASDVYAIGVMMYHFLTGAFPYPVDGSLIKVLREICETPPNDPCQVEKTPFSILDPIFAGIIMKCLNKNPESRYTDAAALALELEAYLAGKLLLPRKPTHRLWSSVVVFTSFILPFAWFYVHRHSATEPVPVIQLPTFTNSVGIDFVQVPTGEFKMGSSYIESGHRDNEQSHIVRITRSFLVGRSEVTRRQYRRVTGSLPPGVPDEPDDFPVDNVSWKDTEIFCLRLHEIDGRDYRLPTEAEWEYACRAGTSGAFATSSAMLPEMAWYAGNSGGTLHSIGKRQPNPWGLYDMHGNVAELTTDRYIPHLGVSPQNDPVHSTGSNLFVVRGGSATDFAGDCRSATRASILSDTPRPGIGFRIVIVLHTQTR